VQNGPATARVISRTTTPLSGNPDAGINIDVNSVHFLGQPVEIRYSRDLVDTAGNPAHAATFIRVRLIILDAELTENPAEHERILLHELFHFTWVRSSNSLRHNWEKLLHREWNERARGEAGWSAEWRKQELKPADPDNRTRKWREYCCESFCDTLAAVHASNQSSEKQSEEMTLSRKRLAQRAAFLSAAFPGSAFPI
jgi:hypothetical protein